ncbi:LacI family DNA-binding transcriptional regulator [Quadrisphaera sp. DSM 44207]|uniref:LacI family DNA-binding transcriptional regulator n=1 Tax=Quadrisphaera sp. DSM 44207 TaxID=1881057 RepID=UPI000885A666|nr:LacI family DNA-binding transcriptional regulator [Quadrisphaera sp. DSM 44207]SDQ34675.1 transcriptional regulator, LacI family [Quadrisphaera sp. DSM 44207]
MPRARLQDVAELAGVSIKTVSNVVNAHPQVRPDTRQRVQAAISALGYRPHAVGRQLRRGRTGLIALAVPELDAPYFAELARHVVTAAAAAGLTVLVEQTDRSLDAERAVVDAREAGLVDGIVLNPVAMSAEELQARSREVPMVLVGEGARPAGVDHVGIDDHAAAAGAVDHLVRGGRRRIAFLGTQPPGPLSTATWRQEGWAQALRAAGLDPAPELELPAAHYVPEEGRRAAAAAVAAGTDLDALLCANDLLALGALRGLEECGLRVPDDVAVVGWDDVAFAAYLSPPLSSVRPDLRHIATSAVEMLTERVEGTDAPGRRVVARSGLVVRRSSTGSPAPAQPVLRQPAP